MLEVNHLTVQYGAIKGVDDISFRVGKGEIVTLIGANGAGQNQHPAGDFRSCQVRAGLFHPLQRARDPQCRAA